VIFSFLKKIILKKKIEKKIQQSSDLKIIIGAAHTEIDGWISTNRDVLDLLKPDRWQRLLGEPKIKAILAEHVWEHLTEADALFAAQLCYKFLKPGGYMRVAVPDGYFPNQEYIDYVKPGGHGAGSDDHKVLYNYKTFKSVFENAGFKVDLLEYFDEGGQFCESTWNAEDGMIFRSKRFDERNTDSEIKYSSIIIDAKK
jgi:predicted SAM-dependent methyltransferase